MILNETYTLENGLSIPKLGLGTWFIDDDQAAEAVRTAVKLGYRLIDTAQAYGNERGVGEGVRTCGVPREELFVASKVAVELKTYDEAKKSIDETLEKMGLDYLDQMIIHSPQPWNQFRVEKRYSEENKAVWRALEDAQSEGKVRVIGVSNFLRQASGGGVMDMFGNFFRNLGSGNVSGLGIAGLVAAAFLIFGRFGWLGKIAGAFLGMMLIGNNAGVLRTQETGNVQRSRTPDLPAEKQTHSGGMRR